MTKKITIAIDAMGGENAPTKNLQGLDLFIKKINLIMIFKLIYTEIKKL